MSAIKLRVLHVDDISPAAKLLSMAMLDNPIHVAVYGAAGATERLALERRFRVTLEDRPGEATVATNVAAAILLLPTGMLLFKEQPSLLNIVGVGICILGLVMVNASNG